MKAKLPNVRQLAIVGAVTALIIIAMLFGWEASVAIVMILFIGYMIKELGGCQEA